MQQNEKQLSLHCVTHRNSYYQFLSLDKDNLQNRLICPECLIPKEQGNVKKELINLIPLSIVFVKFIQALNSPQTFLEWMKKEEFAPYLKILVEFTEKNLDQEFLDQITKVEEMLNVFKEFKKLAQQQLEEYKALQMKFKQYRENFYEVKKISNQKINYKKFCELLFHLQELDKQLESDQYKQVSGELSKNLDGILKDNFQLIQKEIDQINEGHEYSVNNLQKLIKQQFQQINANINNYESYIEKLNDDAQIQFQSQLLPYQFFLGLKQKIEDSSNQMITKKNLIYLSSRDGLNQLWKKADGQKNLLLIFKSKNKFIFGAFSPCQFYSKLSRQAYEDTVTPFLFSETNNLIYPLENDRRYYANNYYFQGTDKIFSEGHDIIIASIFQRQQHLHLSHQWEQYLAQISNEIFGGREPNVIECEIFELIFE